MKKWKQLSLCILSLLLVIGLTVSVQASGESTEWISWQNPLYPELPVPERPVTRTVTKEAVCRDTLQEAAADLREGLKKREATVAVSFMTSSYSQQQIHALFDMAVAHTGQPKEGDYIYRHHSGWSASIRSRMQGAQTQVEVTFTMRYLSTAEQEAEVDVAVKKLLDQLDVYNATDYKKICAIYDYMCENITYDYAGLAAGGTLHYTAYAALINGTSVCQGYASLFYRLALELGVDARMIAGTGNGGRHAWNIVKLDGRYYNLDATWDAPRKQYGQKYDYYLRCDANFWDHARDEEYLTEEFQQTYLMAQEDYSGETAIVTGDMDGDARITEDDAIFLLQSILLPDFFRRNQAADYCRNGKVDEDDAIYLLQHVLMPELFPL